MAVDEKQRQVRRFVVLNNLADGPFKEARKPRTLGVLTGDTNETYNDDLYNGQPITTDHILAGFYQVKADHCTAQIVLDDDTYNLAMDSFYTTPNDPSTQTTGVYDKGGDITITASGKPDTTYIGNPYRFNIVKFGNSESKSYAGFPFTDEYPDRIKGDGLIVDGGARGGLKYTFQREGNYGFQHRTTANYYGRVPEVLIREPGDGQAAPVAGPPKAYIRPKMLPLKNGNVLAVYLDGGSNQTTWTYRCNQPRNTGGGEGNTIKNGPSSELPYMGSDNVRMQLLTGPGNYWSRSMPYHQTITPGQAATYLASEGSQVHVTGHDFVQFPDSGEILYISAGFLGTVETNNFQGYSGFLCVDTLLNDCDDLDSFVRFNRSDEKQVFQTGASYNAEVPIKGKQRSYTKFHVSSYNQFSGMTAGVAGVTVEDQILAMSAEVLPSGRLVVMMATRRRLVSLISDDRGATFRGKEVLDLRFPTGDDITALQYNRQRWASVDTCLDRNGKMLVFVVGQGLGSRRNNSLALNPGSGAGTGNSLPPTESLCSVFVTSDGEDFGSEKRLGQGPNSRDVYVGIAQNTERYPNTNSIDDAVHCLSGSISMLPNGYICAQVVTLAYGSPTGSHCQWVAQAVFSTRDVVGGDTDVDISKPVDRVLFEHDAPLHVNIGRFRPSLIQYARPVFDSTQQPTFIMFLRNAQVPNGQAPSAGSNARREYDTVYTPPSKGSPQDPIKASNNGWIHFPGLARSGSDDSGNDSQYGGGPVWVNGPMDIAQCLHRDRLLTLVCWQYQHALNDFPGTNAIINNYQYRGDDETNPNGEIQYERSVACYQSNFLQPLNVRIPSQLRVFAPKLMPGYDSGPDAALAASFGVTNAFTQQQANPPSLAAQAIWRNENILGLWRPYLNGSIFAGNTFSVAWDASVDPTVQMWSKKQYLLSSGSDNGDQVRFRDSTNYDRIAQGFWELSNTTTSTGNNFIYYEYPGAFETNSILKNTGTILNYAAGNCFDHTLGPTRACFMPNPMGLALPFQGLDTGTANRDFYINANKDAYSFVLRMVLRPVRGVSEDGNTVSASGTVPAIGAEVRLFGINSVNPYGESAPSGYTANLSSMIVGVEVVNENFGPVGSTDQGKFKVYMYINGDRYQTSPGVDAAISFEQYATPSNESDDTTFSGIGTPPNGFMEVVFGLSAGLQNNKYQPFLFAREWKRDSDPDFLADFKFDSVMVQNQLAGMRQVEPLLFGNFDPETADSDQYGNNGIGEYIRFGHVSGSSLYVSGGVVQTQARCSHWKSVQFARGFLNNETCDASLGIDGALSLQQITQPTAKMFKIQDRARGATSTAVQNVDGQELFRFLNEPAMQQFQHNEAGVMSPMSVPIGSDAPAQMIDRGLRVAFRGRGSTARRFTYEAKSRFGPENVLTPPLSYGYRSHDRQVEALVWPTDVRAGSKVLQKYTPSAEITLDFGENGVYPAAVALFGLNNPCVMLEFTSKIDSNGEPVFRDGLTNTNSSTMLIGCAPPCDPWIKAWLETHDTLDFQSSYARNIMRYRYLFYAQFAYPKNGNTDSNRRYDLYLPKTLTASSGVANNPNRLFIVPAGDAPFSPRSNPFTPHMYRSTEGESFFLVFYTREVMQFSPQHCAMNSVPNEDQGPFKHVFKIKDNGFNWIDLTSNDLDDFGNYYNGSTTDNSGLEIGAWCIVSDRFSLNIPENKAGMRPYRFLRVRFSGAVYHDPGNQAHTLSYIAAGSKIDLSNRDFDYGWTKSVESGHTLTTTSSGQRRSRRRHKPRQVWNVSYTPKGTIERTIAPASGTGVLPLSYDGSLSQNIDNPQAGFGEAFGYNSAADDSQVSSRSFVTWNQLVDRVTRVGIGGEVFVLGFDAHNMVYPNAMQSSIRQNYYYPETITKTHPVLSDPNNLVAARLTGFSGAKNVGYQGREAVMSIRSPTTGNGGRAMLPRSVVAVEGLVFSEEL